MKFSLFVCTILWSSAVVLAEDTPSRSGVADSVLAQETIGRIRVQAISQALVELKLQEIALQRAATPNVEKLGLVRAQQVGLQQEIVKITLSTLEDEERRLSEKYLPEHPRMKSLRAEIEARKAELKKLG